MTTRSGFAPLVSASACSQRVPAKRLDAGEVDVVAAFAAEAGFQQFVAPFGVAERGAGAGDGGVEQRRRRVAKIGE